LGASPYILKLREKVGHELIMVPVVGGLVINADGHVLLHKPHETNRWGTPGGAIEPGEPPAQACVREVFEETGVVVRPQKVIGVYHTTEHTYRNGDRVAAVVVAFLCTPVSGKPQPVDDESIDVRYFPPDALPPDMCDDQRDRIHRYLSNPGTGDAHFLWDDAWLKVD
jgi:8-oxo-dGTP pyrophosphatase MutT (NUDIX family)